jgi:hypothetical protein
MKHVWLLAAVVVVAALVAAPVSAARDKWVRGPVASMAANTVTVTVNGADTTFTVERATRVIARGASTASREAQKAGKAGPTLGELVKVGQYVEVHYKEVGGSKVASEIRPIATTEEAASTEPAATNGNSAAGTVVSVTASTLLLKGEGKELTFTVTSKTRVTGTGLGTKARELASAGKPSPITEFIGANDRVVVYFSAEGATATASSIRVIQKAAR